MKDDVKSDRLTAYVLGELDQAERAVLEKELDASSSLSEEVEKIRQTASLLREELAKEPRLHLSQQQRNEIEKAFGFRGAARISRGWFLAAGGLAAAACLVTAVLLTSVITRKSDGLTPSGAQLARYESKENSAIKPESPDIASSRTATDQVQLRRSSERHGTNNRIKASRGREQDKSSNTAVTTFDGKGKADELRANATQKQTGDTTALEPLKQEAAAYPPPPKQPVEETNAALKFTPAVGTLTSARLKSEAPQSRAGGVSGGARSGHAGEAQAKSVQPLPAQSSLDQAAQENLISGAVTNTSDQPLSGARIKILDLKTGLSTVATSDDKGRFQIIGLPASSFHVEVELASFKKFSQDLVLHQREKLQINVKLLPVEKK
ncbi:MAG TPA: carboxypeptidase regulatory-like domain-containing protein [Acidobacteriota bacterium]